LYFIQKGQEHRRWILNKYKYRDLYWNLWDERKVKDFETMVRKYMEENNIKKVDEYKERMIKIDDDVWEDKRV